VFGSGFDGTGVTCLRGGTIYHMLIRIGDFFLSGFFFNNHVMLVKELQVLISPMSLFVYFSVWDLISHSGFHRSIFVRVVYDMDDVY
jgi:hypothetical protein